MKHSFVFLRIACLLSLVVLLGTPLATPISEHGKLSVSGRKILDKNNNEYVLRGMSMFWDKWEGVKFYNQGVVNTLAGSSWQSNVVRAAIDEGGVSRAKDFMDWTASAGIYVIIDWHKHDLNESGAKSFFSDVSAYAKQKNYTHVIYEIYNEPTNVASGGPNWSQIKTYAQNVITEIRKNDADGIVLVGTTNMSSTVSDARSNPLPSTYKNVMYVLHFYASDTRHNVYQTQLKNAYCDDFPVFISEWGTSEADGGQNKGDEANNYEMVNGWMSFIEAMGLSWANWSVVDKNESSAALSLNCCGNGSFSDNNLSNSGKYVQKIIKGRNTGGSLSSVGLSTTSIDCGSPGGTETGVRDGIAIFNKTTNAANYGSVSGADSANPKTNGWGLQNSANIFTAGFTITEIPEPGFYKIRFRYSATSNATVSWSGSGLEDGSTELTSSSGELGSNYKNTSFQLIKITASPSTPLEIKFNASGANSLVFANFYVGPLDSADSAKWELSPTPIIPNPKPYLQAFDMQGRNLVLHTAGNVEIYSMQGKREALFKAKENGEIVSLQNLPAGVYLAVLRRQSGLLYTKTIYLR